MRIDVEDDGGGIDVDAVRDALRVRGAIHVEQLALDERELLDQLCLAGMSTRDEVSEVSGRGVGLAAVKNVVTAMGGRVEVESTLGVGTTWRFRFPLTNLRDSADEGDS